VPVWTPGERRGALLLALLLLLGAARDLWRARHPAVTAPPVDVRLASAVPPAGAPRAGSAERGPSPAAATLVDINRAGAAELDGLPGIGPVLADRILRHRRAHGPFREPDDLLAVPGIGPRLLERLRPRVCVGGADPSPDRREGPRQPDTTVAGVAFGNPAPGRRVQISVQTGGAGRR